MVEYHVYIFCDLHTVYWGMKRNISERLELTAVVACDPDDGAALFFGILHSVDNIFRIATARNSNHDIAGLEMSLELETENFLKSNVVGHRHNSGYIIV